MSVARAFDRSLQRHLRKAPHSWQVRAHLLFFLALIGPSGWDTWVSGTRKSPRRPSSVRPVYTSAPTALTQLDEENVQGCSSLAASSTFLRPNEPASPSPMKGGSRQQTLLREFLSAKSPRKRLGKVARVLLSPCSKSPMARQDVENDALDFSSVS